MPVAIGVQTQMTTAVRSSAIVATQAHHGRWLPVVKVDCHRRVVPSLVITVHGQDRVRYFDAPSSSMRSPTL